MSIDVLQEKIRKLKNPFIPDLTLPISELPPHLMVQEENAAKAYGRFCKEMMNRLKGCVAGVRISATPFLLLGVEGMEQLTEVLQVASANFYVALEAPQILSPMMAQAVAEGVFGNNLCDGLILPVYPGTDCVKPFLPFCTAAGKDLFCVVRTSNKSAPELQDLLTGSRLVHTAAADLIGSLGADTVGRCGYARVAVMAGASSVESLRSLRSKYPKLFLLLDDMDYSCCNTKICASAFDRFGHGAAVCVGPTITTAWKQANTDGTDYLDQAAAEAERLKKNLGRYVAIL